jgi:hypothetical protein
VILVAVRRDDPVELPVALLLDVLRHPQHEALAGGLRLTRAAEVYQDVAVETRVVERQEEAVAETDLVGAQRHARGLTCWGHDSPLLGDSGGLRHRALPVHVGEAAEGRSPAAEEAVLPEELEALGLALAVVDAVADVVLQPPVLVEDERAAAVERHLLGLGHPVGQSDLHDLQLGRLEGDHLHVLGDRLAQGEAVGPDAQARAHREHAAVRLVVEAERLAVVPDEAVHLVRVALHRLEVRAGVVEAALRRVPEAGVVPRAVGGRVDAVADEALEQRVAEVVLGVERIYLAVGGQDGAQEVAELEVDGRGVVERADDHREEVVGGGRALLDHAPAVEEAGGDRAERAQAVRPHFEEGVHHRGDQNLAAAVRLRELGRLDVVARGRERGRAPQGVAAHRGHLLPHLLGEPEQYRVAHPLGRQRPERDLLGPLLRGAEVDDDADDVRQREDREQRDDVGEALVEAGLLGRGRIGVALAQAVEQRVRRLVRHHVVREAAPHHAPAPAGEVAEHERLVALGVEGVGVGEGVRRDLDLVPVEAPAHAPPQRELEPRQRPHHDGVDVLGVESRVREQLIVRGFLEGVVVGLGLEAAVLDGAVERAGRRVVIDHVDAVAPRAGGEVFGGHVNPRAQYPPAGADARVLCDDRQFTFPRRG